MKAVLQLIPVILSLLLSGAHFLRGEDLVLVGVCVVLIGVLLIRHPIAARIVQVALVLAAVEWVRTLFELVAMRAEHGMPWMRLAIILGVVACFTLVSAGVFHLKTLRARYDLQ